MEIAVIGNEGIPEHRVWRALGARTAAPLGSRQGRLCSGWPREI